MASIFRKLTHELMTAHDLQQPLGKKLEADLNLDEVGLPGPGICLVVDKETGVPIGWVDEWILMEEWDSEREKLGLSEDVREDKTLIDDPRENPGIERVRVKDVMKEITVGKLLAASTPAYKVAMLVSECSDTFLVLDSENISGSIEYKDMFRPTFLLCFIAMIFELENASLRFLKRSNALKNWRVLKEHRRDAARKRFNDTEREGPNGEDYYATEADVKDDRGAAELLEKTMLCDKGEILRITDKATPLGWSKSKVQSLFGRAGKIRNHAVHPKGSTSIQPLLNRSEFGEFIRDVLRATVYFNEACEQQ